MRGAEARDRRRGRRRGGEERGALPLQNDGPTPQDGWEQDTIGTRSARQDMKHPLQRWPHFGIGALHL
eukprot:5411497-Pyramimonas_sp.AAC.1